MKNKLNYSVKSKIIIVTAMVILALLITNQTVNNIYFNPYESEEASYPFHIITQLVSPSVSYSYTPKTNSSKFAFMSYYEQEFVLDQYPEHSQSTSGLLKYRFGKASVKHYVDNLNFHALTCKQSIFTENSTYKFDANTISQSKQYEVWFSFKTPLNQGDFTQKYGWLLDNNISRPKTAGLIWLAIQTSDNCNDVCIGAIGNQSTHFLHNPIFNIDLGNSITMSDREELFRSSLTYLKNRPKDTNMYLNCGLFENAEDIDFGKRLQYINENGIKYIGMSGYMAGYNIIELAKYKELNIVKIVERS